MSTLTLDDTIAAVATPPGSGGVGIVRISGPNSFTLLSRIFIPRRSEAIFTPYLLLPGSIVDPQSENIIDTVLAVRFVAPHSYTGEDSVEIQAHGGRLNLLAILDLVLRNGARPARPGEFTLRAFLNGKVDLTRAEAVRSMIESRSEAALKISRRQLEGELCRFCEDLRQGLIDILALIEAHIDFPDEELPENDRSETVGRLKNLEAVLVHTAETYTRGRLLQEGIEVFITGRPNVGKSSLLNRLLRSERAIVTDTPGTTRDFVDGALVLNGIQLRLVDSAGLRDAADGVEFLGVQRAWDRLGQSDFVLWVLDRSEPLTQDDLSIGERLRGHRGFLVFNKCDLPKSWTREALDSLSLDWPFVEICAKSGEGVNGLERGLGLLLAEEQDDSAGVILMEARHQEAFSLCAEAVSRARSLVDSQSAAPEIVAAALREALDALDALTGVTTTEEILNAIFSRFCIGK